MASDDTPRIGESASGNAYSTEQELQVLLNSQLCFLRDTVTQAERSDDLEEAEELLRELGRTSHFLADAVGAMEGEE